MFPTGDGSVFDITLDCGVVHRVQVRRLGGEWSPAFETPFNHYTFGDLKTGWEYECEVWAKDTTTGEESLRAQTTFQDAGDAQESRLLIRRRSVPAGLAFAPSCRTFGGGGAATHLLDWPRHEWWSEDNSRSLRVGVFSLSR